MNTHTPGPWIVEGYPIAQTIEPNICDMVSSLPPHTVLANARLLASAPELLAACREAQLLIHYLLCGTPHEAPDLLMNQGEKIESLLRHAIAKAEGRG